ncbi:PAS domain-containing sensor histidine kinase [Rhodoferax sp.]|uniref:sensor histidine kinase n=1 Tax=Rhodoferax sp. TaxID=50421 RepID=UPI0025D5E985|nr:PAS domain-containing sensor histidine kinase [Rhodoferax sp.]
MSLLKLSLPAQRMATDVVLCVALASAGLMMTATVYDYLHEAALLRNFEQRNALAETVVAALDRDATATLEAVRGTALLAEMMPGMTGLQFEAYTRRLQGIHSSIASLQWERFTSHGGYIFPPNRSGWTGRAAAQLEEAQKDARIVGTPIATGPFALPETARTGVALTVPVYERMPGVPWTYRQIGFINALIDTTELSRHATSQAQSAASELLITERGAEDHSLPVYSGLSDPEHRAGHDNESMHPEKADHLLELGFGGRSWQVLIHPVDGKAAGPLHRETLVLIVGLMLTALLTFLLARSQQSRRQTEEATAQEKLLRDELLEEQYRLKEVVESTGVAIWEYDLERCFLSVSDRWHIVSGYSREELGDNVLESWQRLVHPVDWPNISRVFGQLSVDTSERFGYEYRMRHKSGYWMWIDSRAHVIERNPEGRPIKIAGINLEVTQQRDAEIRIQALNASLEVQMQEALARSEARATLGTLIASVSHEMATPMGNSMMTASTLSAQAVQFDAQLAAGNLRRSELAAFVNSVKDGNTLLMRNLERAVALLKNFRQVASDQASEQRRQFDLRQCLQEVLATLAPSLKRHSHRVVLEVPEGLTMDSYPGPLGQVVINLINNAYLHAFEGIEQGEVLIAATADDQLITLSCTDNGQGIAEETLEKMFQPFFSTRIGRGGTGLGMSIVENLVKATMGGTLEVQSTVGKGTTVTITLPSTAPELRQEEEGA